MTSHWTLWFLILSLPSSSTKHPCPEPFLAAPDGLLYWRTVRSSNESLVWHIPFWAIKQYLCVFWELGLSQENRWSQNEFQGSFYYFKEEVSSLKTKRGHKVSQNSVLPLLVGTATYWHTGIFFPVFLWFCVSKLEKASKNISEVAAVLRVKDPIFVTLSGTNIWYNNPTKYKAISNCCYVFWK